MNNLDDIDNMTKCIQVFVDYMFKTFDVDVVKMFPSTNPRKLLYDNITAIKRNPYYTDHPLKVLNNICLNKMRDFYVQYHGLVSSKKPNQRPLERDQQLYGNRPNLSDTVQIPMNTNAPDKNMTEVMYQQLLNSRDPNKKGMGDMTIPIPQISEKKMGLDDFQMQYDRLQQQRDISNSIAENENSYYAQGRTLHQDNLSNRPADPQHFYNSLKRDQNVRQDENTENDIHKNFISDNANDNIVTKTTYDKFYNNQTVPHYNNPGLRSLQEQPTNTYISPDNYLMINGYDRDWIRHKSRFQFTVEISKFAKTYKNIHEITCTKLIIPSEIVNEKSITNPNPKLNFVHNYRLSVPYLTLQIDEISDVCDGANQTNQKAFVHFVQDCVYNCENGRGYTIMKPLQDEKKVYHPTPLASLPKLSISITKPNGSLFNNATDRYSVWKVEYEEYNKQYLKIVLDDYFDKNEFYKSDVVIINKFKMPLYDEDNEDNDNDPAYSHYINNSYTYNRITEFINRHEGHDIIECGKPNSKGFFRSFMIQAPGDFDTDNGCFVIDKAMVDLIKKHNEQNFPQLLTPSKVGHIINTTLQPTVSMKIKTSMGNAAPCILPQII